MKFNEALMVSGLGPRFITSNYYNYGQLTKESMDLVLRVGQMETASPSLIAFTWMNESSFRFYPEPNTNNQPDNSLAWDFGPMQINRGLYQKNVEVRWFRGLPEEDVFGREFYEDSDVGDRELLTPSAFTGNPLINLQAGARHLNRINGDLATKASLYTGPKARPYRLKAWAEWEGVFNEFFNVYHP